MAVNTRDSAGRSRRAGDPVARLFDVLGKRHGTWEPANVSFRRRFDVKVDGAAFRVVCSIHGMRRDHGASRIDLKSSVTIWPPRRAASTPPARDLGDSSARYRAWRLKWQRKLRGYGYHGRWDDSPFGPFGNFWKTLRSMKDVLAEVKLLEGIRL